MSHAQTCPTCCSDQLRLFHRAEGVPVNSCLSLGSREEALSFPTGCIELTFCESCGFIFNRAFDESLIEYSERYDPTQAFSGTFNRWHKQLAEHLVQKYDLHGKQIIEIGCGKGEFLTMLCELGSNSGVGFDPAVNFDRTPVPAAGETRFVQDFYSEKYADQKGDFVCCKMTLEHIAAPADFVNTVRRVVGDDAGVTVFFQVPDVCRILQDQVFVDIYYEHCNYFCAGSLARLFRRSGFRVRGIECDYDGQYLMIDCCPAGQDERASALEEEQSPEELSKLVDHFSEALPKRLDRWKRTMQNYHRDGKRVILWGGGSKGVAFLTTLGLGPEIDYVVDINPYKQNDFLPVTGHQIVGPDRAREAEPDVVIVMNPIYIPEIRKALSDMGLSPHILSAEA